MKKMNASKEVDEDVRAAALRVVVQAGTLLGFQNMLNSVAREMQDLVDRERAKLNEIAKIIESVDDQAMACDGPVTPTKAAMSDVEFRKIYWIAKGKK